MCVSRLCMNLPLDWGSSGLAPRGNELSGVCCGDANPRLLKRQRAHSCAVLVMPERQMQWERCSHRLLLTPAARGSGACGGEARGIQPRRGYRAGEDAVDHHARAAPRVGGPAQGARPTLWRLLWANPKARSTMKLAEACGLALQELMTRTCAWVHYSTIACQ